MRCGLPQWTGPVLVALCVMAGGMPCRAQSRGLFGGSGPQNRSSLGGPSTPSPFGSGRGMGQTGRAGASNSGFGNSTGLGGSSFGFGNNGLGTSGLGNSGQGMQGFGNSAFGASTGLGTTGFGAQGRTSGAGLSPYGATGAGQFGRGNALGQSFGAGNFGSRGGFGSPLMQRNSQNQPGTTQPGTGAQTAVRIRPQIAFEYPERAAAAVVQTLEVRFDRITNRSPELRNIRFERAVGGRIIMRGTVPRESAKRLAAALVRLEPGVRSVQNELTVAPAR